MGEATPSYERTPFGKQMLKHFAFGPGYRSLNHGRAMPLIHSLNQIISILYLNIFIKKADR